MGMPQLSLTSQRGFNVYKTDDVLCSTGYENALKVERFWSFLHGKKQMRHLIPPKLIYHANRTKLSYYVHRKFTCLKSYPKPGPKLWKAWANWKRGGVWNTYRIVWPGGKTQNILYKITEKMVTQSRAYFENLTELHSCHAPQQTLHVSIDTRYRSAPWRPWLTKTVFSVQTGTCRPFKALNSF